MWIKYIEKIISHLVLEKVQEMWMTHPSSLLKPLSTPIPIQAPFSHITRLHISLSSGPTPFRLIPPIQDARYPCLSSPTLNSSQAALFPVVRIKRISLFRLQYLCFTRSQLEVQHDLKFSGNSLAIQWLGLSALTARGPVLILGWGTKIPEPAGNSKLKKSYRTSSQLFSLP